MNNFIKNLKVKRKELLLFSFLIFIAVLPFKLILAPISFSILAICYVLWGEKNISQNIRKHKNVLLIVLLFLINLLGLFLSPDLGVGYERIGKQLFLFLVPCLFVLLNLNKENIQKAKQLYVMSCVLFCTMSFMMLFYNFYADFARRLDYDFIQRSMYHDHFPYDTLTINIGYIILLFSIKNKLKPLVSALFFVFIVLSGVRMGQFLFALITFIYLVVNFKKLLNAKSLILLFLFLVGGILLVKNSRYANDKFFDSLSKLGLGTEKYVSDIGEKYHNVSLREKLWETAIITLKESPNKILGYGPRGSKPILNNLYKEKGYLGLENTNSHNQYLTTLLDNGFLGLFLLIFIIALGLRGSLNAKSSENFVIILVITVALITESLLERQKGVSLFAVFLTLAYIENNIINQKQN